MKALQQVVCVHYLNSNSLVSGVAEKNISKREIGVRVSPTPTRCSDSSSSFGGGGVVRREVLSNQGRTKHDSSSDRNFYSFSRFVKHVDDRFLLTLTALYRERISEGAEVLDLCSSWVSHLPPDVKYKSVVGHGLNAAELSKNSRLDYFFVKDLNEDPKLESANCSFDAVLCAVSVQYLQQPEKVFAEIYRILKPGGVCIVSFSNRMFYDKAVAAWRDGSSYSRTQLVVQYFQCVVGFSQPEVVRRLPNEPQSGDSGSSLLKWIGELFTKTGSDPFYAVVAYRNFKTL